MTDKQTSDKPLQEITFVNGTKGSVEDLALCVGAGWRPLIRTLCTDLFALGWDGFSHQVKEKFGGLRFYIGSGSDAIFARISKAEEESYHICEECGAPGVLRGSGWLMTRRDAHAEGRKSVCRANSLTKEQP